MVAVVVVVSDMTVGYELTSELMESADDRARDTSEDLAVPRTGFLVTVFFSSDPVRESSQ